MASTRAASAPFYGGTGCRTSGLAVCASYGCPDRDLLLRAEHGVLQFNLDRRLEVLASRWTRSAPSGPTEATTEERLENVAAAPEWIAGHPGRWSVVAEPVVVSAAVRVGEHLVSGGH